METRNTIPGTDIGSRPGPGAAPHNDPDQIRNDMRQAGETMREQARAAGEQIKSTASNAGQQVKESAGEVAEQTQRKAAEYARLAQSQGKEMLDQQKTRAAGQVQTLGGAVRRAADKFREDHDDNIAGYIDAAADEVERLGNYLERRDLNSVWRDAQTFGRRRPEWFLGGMFVAGLALTRFLKASAERHESQTITGNRRYEAPRYGGQADVGHRLPDPSHATRRFAGATGSGATGTMSGSSGMSGDPGTYGTSGTVGAAATLGTARSPGTAGTGGAPRPYGSPVMPSPATHIAPASAPSLTNPTARPTPALDQPRTQPEVH